MVVEVVEKANQSMTSMTALFNLYTSVVVEVVRKSVTEELIIEVLRETPFKKILNIGFKIYFEPILC